MTVGRQIIRALEVFDIGKDDGERRARMLELLDLVKAQMREMDTVKRNAVVFRWKES